MTALVRAELRKLTTTWLWLWMLVLGPAMTGAATSAAIGFAEPGPLGLESAAGQRTVFAHGKECRAVLGPLHHRHLERIADALTAVRPLSSH